LIFSYLKKVQQSQSGQMALGVTSVILVSCALVALFSNTFQASKDLSYLIKDPQINLEYHSASETMHYLFQLEETKYYEFLVSKNCHVANSFLQALKSGSSCAHHFDAFETIPNVVTKSGSCKIKQTDSDCNSLLLKLEKGTGINPFSTDVFEFKITNVYTVRNLVEFLLTIKSSSLGAGASTERSIYKIFYIKNDSGNFIHLRQYAGMSKVVQEKADPYARCAGTDWGVYTLYDLTTANCVAYEGFSETGLAFYAGDFYAFSDLYGKVMSMSSTLTDPSVGEDGKLSDGTLVFPPHAREALKGAEDITVIDKTIYYVRSSNGHIGYLKKVGSTYDATELCDFKVTGWDKSYKGIAALAQSQVVIPGDTATYGNRAIFYLKSGSDLVIVIARIDSSDGTAKCSILSQDNTDPTEYGPSEGFDRIGDQIQLNY